MRNRLVGALAVSAMLFGSVVLGQANGKLQIHFIGVGQGDAAVLISPQGQAVLFDNGTRNHCDKPVAYPGASPKMAHLGGLALPIDSCVSNVARLCPNPVDSRAFPSKAVSHFLCKLQ